METPEKSPSLFRKGDKASTDYFTGDTWINSLVAADAIFHTSVASVTFAPGARNHWHTHPGGQILIATDGTGYYQEKGKPVQVMRTGDVIQIIPGVVHWHGATPGGEFTHLAINTSTQNGLVDWLEPVTDEEYQNLNHNAS